VTDPKDPLDFGPPKLADSDSDDEAPAQKKGHAPDRTVAVCAFVNVQRGDTPVAPPLICGSDSD
jgi:hypothetical protein